MLRGLFAAVQLFFIYLYLISPLDGNEELTELEDISDSQDWHLPIKRKHGLIEIIILTTILIIFS